MRSSYFIAIATVLAVGFGVKLFYFSSPIAEANVDAAKSFRMDVSKMHVSTMLPMQKAHDMTLVFADGD